MYQASFRSLVVPVLPPLFFRELEHSVMGPCRYAGHQFRIRGYEGGPRFAAPALGQHSFEVLSDVLGIDPERIAELMSEGAIE